MITQNPDVETLWAYHDDRQAAIDEVHARPAMEIIAPAIVLHIAFTCESDTISELFTQVSGKTSAEIRRHVINKTGNIDTKIERHTEFTSCTFVASNNSDGAELIEAYRSLLIRKNVKVLSKCQISIVTTAKELAKKSDFGKRFYGGTMRGELQVHSTLETDDQSTINYTVMSEKSGPNELGRRIQRIYELETYRIMALIGLPLARRQSSRLTKLEDQLNQITSKLEAASSDEDVSDEDLFQELSILSGKLDNLRSETRFRFSASNAYFDIVDARIKTLVEQERGDLQTISGFLKSRLEPARATIKSVEGRQKTLTEDISRALALLRTRIDIKMNHGNQALLKSLDGRYKQQLLISQAVEGLSTIAITYYAIGLLSYFLKAFDKAGHLPVSYTLILAAAVPVIMFTVWYSVRRLRLKLHGSED